MRSCSSRHSSNPRLSCLSSSSLRASSVTCLTNLTSLIAKCWTKAFMNSAFGWWYDFDWSVPRLLRFIIRQANFIATEVFHGCLTLLKVAKETQASLHACKVLAWVGHRETKQDINQSISLACWATKWIDTRLTRHFKSHWYAPMKLGLWHWQPLARLPSDSITTCSRSRNPQMRSPFELWLILANPVARNNCFKPLQPLEGTKVRKPRK